MTKPNRTAARIRNMKRLVATMLKGEMSAGHCARVLDMSTSGTRGYTQELVFQKVAVERFGGFSGRAPHFRIPDPDRAAAYLSSLDDAEAAATFAKLTPTAPEFKAAPPDPYALDRDFFKPSAEFLERRLVPRDEPVRLTGFAALTVHFARVAA